MNEEIKAESTRNIDPGQEKFSAGPYIARVIKHADPYYLGGLEVELLKTTEAGSIGETLGQTTIVYYASRRISHIAHISQIFRLQIGPLTTDQLELAFV